jgi:hypothetical protein
LNINIIFMIFTSCIYWNEMWLFLHYNSQIMNNIDMQNANFNIDFLQYLLKKNSIAVSICIITFLNLNSSLLLLSIIFIFIYFKKIVSTLKNFIKNKIYQNFVLIIFLLFYYNFFFFHSIIWYGNLLFIIM